MGIRCADHVTPLHPQKLALTSPTGGGRSVGIVRLRNKATEFSFYVIILVFGWIITDNAVVPVQPEVECSGWSAGAKKRKRRSVGHCAVFVYVEQLTTDSN